MTGDLFARTATVVFSCFGFRGIGVSSNHTDIGHHIDRRVSCSGFSP